LAAEFVFFGSKTECDYEGMNENRDNDVILFTEASRLPAAGRPAFLDRACAGDADLRRRVEDLLNAYEHTGDFLAGPPWGISEMNVPTSHAGEKAGDRIGPYKLLQQIGEGGCGVIFMAEQEEPLHRRIALKVIKPGMDTKQVIARFEAERQALALMDHPSIAQIFEAGATPGGRPYFAMELIRGIKITDYCDQNSFSTRDRLSLFIQVCGAVQHAHQKGIIHRDLKPSNILVSTGDGGRPLPKVIDFGIAKAATGRRLTDKTLFTAFEMLIGTPAYMSPEQAALTSVDVDTRSDIYSLGVLLYELLTGSTPFDTTELLRAGLDEVRRVIREQEPIRPSTRLGTMIAEDQTRISHRRGEEPPRLTRDMCGDLDWIVLKAMEKDRARRYPTANALAMDIERYLAGEIVLARPPSACYKLRKTIGRNKILFSGLVVIFLLLAVSLAVTIRLLVVDRRARAHVRQEEEILRLDARGESLMFARKFPEAEQVFRQSLALVRQVRKGEPPTPELMGNLIAVLRWQNKSEEANAILDEFLEPGMLANPEYIDLFSVRAENNAQLGHWAAAAADARALLQKDPDNSYRYHMLAPLLVADHDLEAYHQLCREIAPRFRDTTDLSIADQMAKDCLILPSPGADLTAVTALADFAVTHGRNWGAYPFFECCKALAEYRQGHFAAAAAWAEPATRQDFPYARAEGLAILAMAQCQLGQVRNSGESLSNCGVVIEQKLPTLAGGGRLGTDWRDWIIANALCGEARELIGTKGMSAEPSKPK